MLVRVLAGGLSAFHAVACTVNDTPAPATVLVTDSLGVEIIDSRAPQLQGNAARFVADEPPTVVGHTVDEREGLFQVGRSLLTSDGRFAVTNCGSNLIKYFRADGTFR